MKNGSLVIDSKEVEVVKKIYQSRKLSSLGYTRRNGKKWRPSALYRILTHKVYLGYTICSGQIKQGEHEAIIDKFTFDAVQKKLKENCRYLSRQISSPHILTGLITCAKCGAKIVCSTAGW